MDERIADTHPNPPPQAHMEKTSFLPCSCGAPCFGQWFSGTARKSRDQVYVCAESMCASTLLGFQSKNTSADEQEGGG